MHKKEQLELYQIIKKYAPSIPANYMYSKDDLVSEVYLKFAKSEEIPTLELIKRQILEAKFRRYRPKYKSHQTSVLTAEELELYCDKLVVRPDYEDPLESVEPSLWDYLKAAVSQLEDNLSQP